MRCGVEAAPVRAEPRDEAGQVTQVLRGDLLEVGERRDGWARVTTSYGYPGWVREEVLCGEDPRDSWQQEEAGTPVEAPEPGDLVTYGGERADHIAFWLCGARPST